MRTAIGMIAGAMIFAAGQTAVELSERLAWKPSAEDFGTELTVAQSLSRIPEARLIGFDCGNHRATVIATHEDEMPPCREIRQLDDVQVFY